MSSFALLFLKNRKYQSIKLDVYTQEHLTTMPCIDQSALQNKTELVPSGKLRC